ncbi:MAG: sulfotransferase [Pseudomonadota bacterium]
MTLNSIDVPAPLDASIPASGPAQNRAHGHDAKSAPDRADDLVFICGALRSGTTLLRIMLDGHPNLSNPGELDFLVDYANARDAHTGQTPSVPSDIHDRIRRSRVFKALGLSLKTDIAYDDMLDDMIDQLRLPEKRLTINIHRSFEHLPVSFPNARYVHLQRDPRDVARSSIGMGWSGNVYHGVGHWIASERSFEKLRARVDDDRVHNLTFEQLVAAPKETLSALCEFLGEPYTAAMLTYPERSTYDAPDPSIIQSWRKKLSPREVSLVESKTAEMMAVRGYEPASSNTRTPSPLERFMLAQENRLGRFSFAIRRYGLPLAAAKFTKRFLPTRSAKRWVEDRVEEEDLKHLK